MLKVKGLSIPTTSPQLPAICPEWACLNFSSYRLGRGFKVNQILPCTTIDQRMWPLCYTIIQLSLCGNDSLCACVSWGIYPIKPHSFLTLFQSLVPLGTRLATSADYLERWSLSHCLWFIFLCRCDSGCNGAVVNQALGISTGSKSVTPHSLLLSLLRPVGNAENAKLLPMAKQVQSTGDQPHPKERKHKLRKITGWSLFQMMPFCRILYLYPWVWSLASLLVQRKFYILSTLLKSTTSSAKQRGSAEAPAAWLSIGQTSFPAPWLPRQLRLAASVEPIFDCDIEITGKAVQQHNPLLSQKLTANLN